MTVCIAAICRDEDQEKIVLCSDRRMSSGLGGSEVGRKEHALSHGWRCLVSGDEDHFLALIRLYRIHFLDEARLTYEKIDAAMKAPLYERKKDIAEEYIRKRFAFSHDEFVKSGKDRLPADLFHEANQVINHTDLRASLIVAGFVGTSPEIYYTDEHCGAHPVMNFATIGEGSHLAHSVLLRREQMGWDSLSSTLYNVYEAKKYAESIGSVGPGTNISVMRSDGTKEITSYELDTQLGEAYIKYGPQKVPRNIKFDGDYYYKIPEKIAP
jgi:20S proteasome alpha/beta subunit